MRHSAFVLILACAAMPLRAQAPRITPAGDPSVKADTIYRLAVDPKKFPEQQTALLLDDGVIRYDAQGRGTRTFRSIVQVLKPGAVENLQERSWSYSPAHEKLTVNWVRVVALNGHVISAKPSHVQDSDVPADDDTPIYSDRRVRRASLSGVAVGTLVDCSYTIEETKPFLPGDFFESWSISSTGEVARSRYIVDVPSTMALHIRERNLSFPRKEAVIGGRRVYTWALNNVPRIKIEAFAADSNDVTMSVNISGTRSWTEIGHWYADLARPHSSASAKLNAKVDSLVRGAHTLDDSLRAVHKWVAQDVRYIAIDLGMSGYQPRMPDTVAATGFGDCKDKATLFVTALTHLGVTAYPVILNSSGGVRVEMPSIHQLDHEIAAIKRPDGYQFVDLTASFVPMNELPYGEQGEFGLVVHPDGSSEVVKLPKADLLSNHDETRIVGTLNADGTFDGAYEEDIAGSGQSAIRSMLANPLDSAQRHNVGNAIARRYFENADGDSLIVTNGKDLTVAPHIRALIRHGRAATPAGANMILQIPVGSMASLAGAAKEMSEAEKRRFPIDAAKFWGERTTATTVRITLPDGWRAELPKTVIVPSDFGRYSSEYKQEGRVLSITRRITGARGVYPPERITDLIAMISAVSADDAKIIVLNKTPVAGSE